MKLRNFNILILVLSLLLVSVGCKKATESLVLKEIGPTKIKSGEGFYIQSHGESAMWAKTENATETTVIVWGETKLHTTFGSSKGLTALVPKELYFKPGQFQIYLFDTKTGAKSNSIVLTVEE